MAEQWEISYSGFLEHKTGLFGSWNLYWVVLDKDVLIIFDDETETEVKGKVAIEKSCIVEAEAGQAARSFLFSLRNENIGGSKLLFSAFDIGSLEGWMIALIQAINGSYRASENFCTGASICGAPSTFVLPPDVQIGREYSGNSEFEGDIHFVKTGYLIKQGSIVKSWKRRMFTLKDNHLTYADSASVVKGERLIDDESRVVVLPPEFDGRPFCFALLTTDSTGTVSSLRLSAEDSKSMVSWIDAMEAAIKSYKNDYQAFIEDSSEHSSSAASSSPRPTPLSNTCSPPPSEEVPIGSDTRDMSSPCPETFSPAGHSLPLPPPSTASWYLNDDTVWGRMRRRLSWREHSTSNTELQHFYMTHFCMRVSTAGSAHGGSGSLFTSPSPSPPSPPPSPTHPAPYIIVEVFEHQRYVPISGWSPLNLLLTDCAKLANKYGVKFPDRYLRRADAPAGYTWTEESDAVALDEADTGCISPWRWTICKKHTAVGEKGWSYGKSFADIRQRVEIKRSHTSPRATDLVRRRRWLRIAMRAGNRVDEFQLPFQNLFLRAQYSSQTQREDSRKECDEDDK
jgi:hypothetical protein